jgi:hypothetical protein
VGEGEVYCTSAASDIGLTNRSGGAIEVFTPRYNAVGSPSSLDIGASTSNIAGVDSYSSSFGGKMCEFSNTVKYTREGVFYFERVTRDRESSFITHVG